MVAKPKLIVILGETASGKSALALKLAVIFNGEIIAGDSRTVYKGMNIGTAKPSPAERAKVPHYLIDIVLPNRPFNAAAYKELALKAINDIAGRGKTPFIVGGSGLYIDGLVYDFNFLPPVKARKRQALNEKTLPELKELAEKRNISGNLCVTNPRHLIRSIETNGVKPTRKMLRHNTLLIGLKIDRGELDRRIEFRVNEMLNQGLDKEVKHLAKKYGWQVEAMKSVGYRQWRPYFAGKQTLEEVRQAIIRDTKNYAKRQRTWFKRDKNIQWVTTTEEARSIVATFLKKNE